MGTSPQIREPRVRFERAVWVGRSARPGRLQRVYAANLSRGGMFLCMPKGIKVGEPITIALGNRQEIIPLAEGEVMWERGEPSEAGAAASTPAGVGIAFRELAPDAPQLIDQLLEAARATPEPPRSLSTAEPITPAFASNVSDVTLPHVGLPLDAEPVTPVSLLPPPRIPPLAPPKPPALPALSVAPPEEGSPETRAFWTGFTLPARRRVQARLLSRELLLDFGNESVATVRQQGNRVTIVFVKPQSPV